MTTSKKKNPFAKSVPKIDKNVGFLVRVRSAIRDELTDEEKTLLLWQVESMIHDYGESIKKKSVNGTLNGYGLNVVQNENDIIHEEKVILKKIENNEELINI